MTVRQADIPITDEDLVKIASQSTTQRNEVEDRGLAYLYPKLSFFFDGTGNNLYQELAKPPQERALSNVAKLFLAAIDDKSRFKKIIPRYVPGVGTPFSVPNPLPHFGNFPDDAGGVAGLGFGAGGDMRIRFAL